MPRPDLEAALFVPTVLVADVAAHFFFFKTNGRDRIATSPEMLAREVAFFALHAGNGNRALALEKTDDRRDRQFRRDLHHHMDVIGHQMPFEDPTFFLPG